MNLSPPSEMPTWWTSPVESLKNTRSPGSRSPFLTEVPPGATNRSWLVRGREMPALAYAHCTRPEQSKPSDGDPPPHLYGVPFIDFAAARASSACLPACG